MIEGINSAILTNVESLNIATGKLLGRRNQFIHGGRRLHASFLQQALAVVQQAHVINHLNGIDLVIDSDWFESGGAEVTFYIRNDVIERSNETSLYLVN